MANPYAIQNSANRARLVRQIRVAMDFPDEVAKDAIKIIGEDFVGEVKGSLVGPGTGRTYVRYNPRRVHTASAPFEPPATDLGRLMGSYHITQIGVRRGANKTRFVEVGSHVEYAAYLEYGTRFMLPRPHLRPASARVTRKIPGIIHALARAKGIRLRSGVI